MNEIRKEIEKILRNHAISLANVRSIADEIMELVKEKDGGIAKFIESTVEGIIKDEELSIIKPSQLKDMLGIHINTAKNLITEFSSIYNSMNKLKESGIELMDVKSPNGIHRLVLLPAGERLKKLEKIERKLGIDINHGGK